MQFPSYLFSENAPRKTQETLILNSFWMSMPPSSLDIYFSFVHLQNLTLRPWFERRFKPLEEIWIIIQCDN